VASFRVYNGLASVTIDRLLLAQQGGHSLEGYAEIDVFAVGDAALYAARIVRAGGDAAVVVAEGVVVFRTEVERGVEAVAVVEALHGIDAKHSGAERGVQLAKDGLAESDGHARDDARDDAAYRLALLPAPTDQCLHLGRLTRVGASHSVRLGEREVIVAIRAVEADTPHLRGIGADGDALGLQGELGHGTADALRNGGACRAASTAARIADAVLHLVGIVSVRRAIEITHGVVVFRMLIAVADEGEDLGLHVELRARRVLLL